MPKDDFTQEQLTHEKYLNKKNQYITEQYMEDNIPDILLDDFIRVKTTPFFCESLPYITKNPNSAQSLKTDERRGLSCSERKKYDAMKSQYRKARLKTYKIYNAENKVRYFRSQRVEGNEKYKKFEDEAENMSLNARLGAITEMEKADLASVEYMKTRMKHDPNAQNLPPEKSVEAQTLNIRYKAQLERAKTYRIRAEQMDLGSKQREKMMEKVEEETLKADHLKREYKVACMPEGAEKQRDAATIKRHDRFDFLKKLFRTPTKYSKADAALNIPANQALDIQQDLKLVNAGRATMGGTKAMYTFVDYNNMQTVNGEDVPQEWLFKEATNCIGRYKPEGAVVTEEASRLQTFMRGELSIPAYCVKDGDKVVGSVQKKIQAVDGGVDLFKWQAQNDLTQNPPSKTTLDDLMNEHTLDWLLCNFDTKGENFINQADGHIISFDKEASFNHLLDGEAQQMSYNYKPHSNDTIYNTMFKAYAEGNIDLDLDANLDSILKIEEKLRLDKENAGVDGAEPSYVEMFKNTLDAKYGAEVTGQRIDAAIRLRDRAANLRETYRTFYTELITQRLEKLAGKPEKAKEYNQLRSRIQNGKFELADERAQRLEDEFNDKVVSEREAELEKIRKSAGEKRKKHIEDIEAIFEKNKKTSEFLDKAASERRKELETFNQLNDTELQNRIRTVKSDFDSTKNYVKDCIEKNNFESLVAKHSLIKHFDKMVNIFNANFDMLDSKTFFQMQADIQKYGPTVQEAREFYIANIPEAIKKRLSNTAKSKTKKLNTDATEKFYKLYDIYQSLLDNIKSYDYNGISRSRKELLKKFKQYDSLIKYFDNINENLTNELKEYLINRTIDTTTDIVPELRKSSLDEVNKYGIFWSHNKETHEKLNEVRSSREEVSAFYNLLLEDEQKYIKSHLSEKAKLKSGDLNERTTKRYNRLCQIYKTLYENMKNYDYDGTLLDDRESLLNSFKMFNFHVKYFENINTNLNNNLKKFLTDIVDDATSEVPEIKESLLNEIKKYGTFWSHDKETHDRLNEMLAFKDEITAFYNLILAQEQAEQQSQSSN